MNTLNALKSYNQFLSIKCAFKLNTEYKIVLTVYNYHTKYKQSCTND